MIDVLAGDLGGRLRKFDRCSVQDNKLKPIPPLRSGILVWGEGFRSYII